MIKATISGAIGKKKTSKKNVRIEPFFYYFWITQLLKFLSLKGKDSSSTEGAAVELYITQGKECHYTYLNKFFFSLIFFQGTKILEKLKIFSTVRLRSNKQNKKKLMEKKVVFFFFARLSKKWCHRHLIFYIFFKNFNRKIKNKLSKKLTIAIGCGGKNIMQF